MDSRALAKSMDLSCVKADHTVGEIAEMAALAKRHGVICAFAMPAHIPLLADLLCDRPDIMIGGPVGFPDGSATTKCKAAEAAEMVAMGVGELDMVANITWLRSGLLDKVRDDIRAVVEAAGGRPVKVILECHYLTDDQIVACCGASVAAGAAWVKTSTGWAPTGATLDNTRLMVDAVAGKCKVKAAGGVRDMATIDAMWAIGVERFGIGVRTAKKLLGEVDD